jgi:hypothetical protein
MATKREIIQPNPGDKRYAQRNKEGRFTDDLTSVGKSLAAARRIHARSIVPKSQADRSDQRRG